MCNGMRSFFHLYEMLDVHSNQVRLRAAVLVGAKFILLAGLLFTTRFRWDMPAVALFLLAFSLLFWAVWVMRKSRLRISPVPAAQAVLMTEGPYRFVRHPMYTSVLLGCGALLIMHFNMGRMVVFLLLVAVLVVKLHLEERLLCARFAGYREYMHKTARLIPYVY